ncbi:MAG: sugar transferase, partial [Anaplasmataceae bacterium]|nr:sugar transferase [Anaplasmataceae bacterium]
FFLVKRDSVGSIFIRQERVGKDGKVFFIYKLRTMYSDVDLYAPSPSGEGDSRITRVGSFLRRYSLDELPQLWNVLKGEMSIVGPRPEMPFLVQRYNDWQRKRLLVKPGITGLWQVFGRKDIPLTDNLEYDFYYIAHQSFLLDLVIILKTIPTIILNKGAY